MKRISACSFLLVLFAGACIADGVGAIWQRSWLALANAAGALLSCVILVLMIKEERRKLGRLRSPGKETDQ